MADPVESFMDSKSVKEKKVELEKKLEALRKKQEKVFSKFYYQLSLYQYLSVYQAWMRKVKYKK